MRILFVVRDHPGRGSRHAAAAAALAGAGHRVTIVAAEQRSQPSEDSRGGLGVLRAGEYPPLVNDLDVDAAVLQFNLAAFERAAKHIVASGADVVHAFGWTAAHTGVALRRAFEAPLVASFQAGSRAVRPAIPPAVESWLALEADRVLVASTAARDRVRASWALPPDRIDVVRAGRGQAGRLEAVYRRAAATHAFRRGRQPVSPQRLAEQL